MTTVVTDNLDEHTILSLTVSTLANVYCERPTPVAKLNRNVLCEEFDDIKHSHQYTRNLHSFVLSRCGYSRNSMLLLSPGFIYFSWFSLRISSPWKSVVSSWRTHWPHGIQKTTFCYREFL